MRDLPAPGPDGGAYRDPLPVWLAMALLAALMALALAGTWLYWRYQYVPG